MGTREESVTNTRKKDKRCPDHAGSVIAVAFASGHDRRYELTDVYHSFFEQSKLPMCSSLVERSDEKNLRTQCLWL